MERAGILGILETVPGHARWSGGRESPLARLQKRHGKAHRRLIPIECTVLATYTRF